MDAKAALKLLNSRIDIGFYCTPAGKAAICKAIGVEDVGIVKPEQKKSPGQQRAADKQTEAAPIKETEPAAQSDTPKVDETKADTVDETVSEK